jgi:hypothetical protein
MLRTKKILTAIAIVLMATVGTVTTAAPAQAADAKMYKLGGGWCC